MNTLRHAILRLASTKAELRPHLLALVASASATEAYAARLREGPLTEADVAGHAHLLEATSSLLRALDDVKRATHGELRAELEDAVRALLQLVHEVSVPMALVAKPTPRAMKKLRP